MNISDLQAKTTRLEHELHETRQLLTRAQHDPEAATAELVNTRAYAQDAAQPLDEVIAGCAAALGSYGFCLIDNVIPASQVDEIRDEVVAARSTIVRNKEAINDLVTNGLNGEELLSQAAANGVELRPVRRVGHPPKPPNDIVWMPLYAKHVANPVITAVARHVLDDHLRIAQLHPSVFDADKSDESSDRAHRSADARGWHTDWPHDLSAYGRGDARDNAGCIRQPFPDVTMCLVMIWYLSDVDENSGATWSVPGSHKDQRNPRGPSDGMSVAAPIPGDMQVTAKAGSVYIQDSRTWHSSPRHNPSDRPRVAMVTRWCPWWLSVDDYAPGDAVSTSIVCRPLSQEEFLALPTDLQPLMRHLCPDERDTLQQPVLDRAAAAQARNQWGLRQMEENPDGFTQHNAHIRVPLGP